MTYDKFKKRLETFASKKGKSINDVDVIETVLSSLMVYKKIDRATARRWFVAAFTKV